MNEGDAIDLVQSAIWMVVVGAGPVRGRGDGGRRGDRALAGLDPDPGDDADFRSEDDRGLFAASLTASFVGAKFSIFTQSIYARIEQGYK